MGFLIRFAVVIVVLVVCTSHSVRSNSVVSVTTSHMAETFDGIGALSAGASSRLLIDYPQQQQSEILDYLFKPNFGASLQILKVEIGGDSESTDGTETSYMHNEDSVPNFASGYEFWLLKEAKRRNPNIKTYGLPWAFPGWVGNSTTDNPYQTPGKTAKYIVEWTSGVKAVHGVEMDYLGVWNERASNANYVKNLRQMLNEAGFNKTKIVASDNAGESICDEMAQDREYAANIDIIGFHYPSDYDNYDKCRVLGKPLWSSEDSSSYDDNNGAACWGRELISHYSLQQMTSTIIWSLVGSYMHGTNYYGTAIMTAVEPWSGHYWVAPVVWATAHVTQFTNIGWRYLSQNNGSGSLVNGGFYNTFVDPNGNDITIVIVKIDSDHAACIRPGLPAFETTSEVVTFDFSDKDTLTRISVTGGKLAYWRSNFIINDAPTFERLPDVVVPVDGKVSISVNIGDMITLTTLTSVGQKGSVSIPDSKSFPLPYDDSFQNYKLNGEAKYFSDQIGAFEIQNSSDNQSLVMKQMVTDLPIGWGDFGLSRGPVSVIGQSEHRDVTVSVSFFIPKTLPSSAAACVATRLDQLWTVGIVLCISQSGNYTLQLSGPLLDGSTPSVVYTCGLSSNVGGSWHQLSLTTIDSVATATLDSVALFTNVAIRNVDFGLCGIGSNNYYPIEYKNFTLQRGGDASHWTPLVSCKKASIGDVVTVRKCDSNGVSGEDIQFELLSTWHIRHLSSKLCVTVNASRNLTLQTCDFSYRTKRSAQLFRNDYSDVRNSLQPLMYGDRGSRFILVGDIDGHVTVTDQIVSNDMFGKWSLFPNTNQLRNNVVSFVESSFPLMCLSVCPVH